MAQDGTISVSLGVTKNTGNYESIRFDASATFNNVDPADPSEWDKAWAVIDDQVDQKLKELGE